MGQQEQLNREPTPREMEILKALWELGPSSVRVVHQQLTTREPDLAYNTIQTMLRIMETKGLVDHVNEGRTFVYSPRFSRDESARRFLERVFDGMASHLVSSLLQNEQISSAELDHLHTLISEARRRNQRSGGAQP